MNQIRATYGQLDAFLRTLGFTSRLVNIDPPTRVYDHAASGASLMLPPFPESERVYVHHLVLVRVTLDQYGLADPATLESRLLGVSLAETGSSA